MNSPRIESLHLFSGGRWRKGVLGISKILCEVVHTIRCCLCAGYVTATFFYAYAYVVQKLHSLLSSIRRIIQPRGWRAVACSAGRDGGSGLLEQSKTRSICHRAALTVVLPSRHEPPSRDGSGRSRISHRDRLAWRRPSCPAAMVTCECGAVKETRTASL